MKLNSCPMCKGELQVREYHCPSCEVSFKGEFESSWLSALSVEQLAFVRLFLMVQGNIREMEKRLNISYPTVKSRLAEILREITDSEAAPTDFADILYDLEQGFVSVDEAINMIETRRKQ
ncbi:MAG: DUF2089 domain-containing protein [Candidatus Cloacimonetes bacterium]|nr:DUF2089 domain-containing protein [Candidatus Cloacimonadota bacterium]